jgi:hypothetical protein
LGRRMPGSAKTERTSARGIRVGGSVIMAIKHGRTDKRVNSLAGSVMEFQRSSKMSVSSLGGGRAEFEHPIVR